MRSTDSKLGASSRTWTRLLLPWSYVIFLTILLTDRARRDEKRCANKYGAFWEEYCAVARWRMIPGIY